LTAKVAEVRTAHSSLENKHSRKICETSMGVACRKTFREPFSCGAAALGCAPLLTTDDWRLMTDCCLVLRSIQKTVFLSLDSITKLSCMRSSSALRAKLKISSGLS